MAYKGINVLLSLTDKFSSQVENATNSTKQMQRQLKQANNVVSGYGKKANSVFKSVVGTTAKVAAGFLTLGGVLSVAGLKAYGSESISLAKEQIEAETKLQAILGNVPSIAAKGAAGIAKAKDNIVGVAEQLEKTGVIGDEVTIAGQQQMATFQLSESSLATLSEGMDDLLAQQKGLNATQEDAVSIGNLIGKAMSGQTGSLSKVGIIFDENQKKILQTGTEAQKATTLAKILQQNVGGVNNALAKTDQGKIQQAKNAYVNMREEIGKKLLPIQAKLYGYMFQNLPQIKSVILGLLDKATAKFDSFTTKIESYKPKIQAMIPTIKSIAKGGFDVLGKAIKFIADNAGTIIPVLAGVVSGFTAFNAISGVVKKVTKGMKDFKKVTDGIKAAKGLKDVIAVFGGPVVIAAVAIGALVAAFIIAYKKSETFRNFVNKLSAKLKAFANVLKVNVLAQAKQITAWYDTSLKPKLSKLKDSLLDFWNNVLKPIAVWLQPVFGAVFKSTFTFILKTIKNVIETAKGIISGLVEILTGVVDFLTGIFTGNWSKAWDGIKEIFTGIFDVLKSAFKGFINYLIDKFNWFTGGLSWIPEKLSKVPGFGWAKDFKIPKVPNFATGTGYFQGGAARINEGGRGEIVNLPNGTQIIPHDVATKQGRNINLNINLNVQGNIIGNKEYANYIGNVIANKVIAECDNMA